MAKIKIHLKAKVTSTQEKKTKIKVVRKKEPETNDSNDAYKNKSEAVFRKKDGTVVAVRKNDSEETETILKSILDGVKECTKEVKEAIAVVKVTKQKLKEQKKKLKKEPSAKESEDVKPRKKSSTKKKEKQAPAEVAAKPESYSGSQSLYGMFKEQIEEAEKTFNIIRDSQLSLLKIAKRNELEGDFFCPYSCSNVMDYLYNPSQTEPYYNNVKAIEEKYEKKLQEMEAHLMEQMSIMKLHEDVLIKRNEKKKIQNDKAVKMFNKKEDEKNRILNQAIRKKNIYIANETENKLYSEFGLVDYLLKFAEFREKDYKNKKDEFFKDEKELIRLFEVFEAAEQEEYDYETKNKTLYKNALKKLGISTDDGVKTTESKLIEIGNYTDRNLLKDKNILKEEREWEKRELKALVDSYKSEIKSIQKEIAQKLLSGVPQMERAIRNGVTSMPAFDVNSLRGITLKAMTAKQRSTNSKGKHIISPAGFLEIRGMENINEDPATAKENLRIKTIMDLRSKGVEEGSEEWNETLKNVSEKKFKDMTKDEQFDYKFKHKSSWYKMRSRENYWKLFVTTFFEATNSNGEAEDVSVYRRSKLSAAEVPEEWIDDNGVVSNYMGCFVAATFFQLLVSNTPVDEKYTYKAIAVRKKRVKVTERYKSGVLKGVTDIRPDKDIAGDVKESVYTEEVEITHIPDKIRTRDYWCLHYKGVTFEAADFNKELFYDRGDQKSITKIAEIMHEKTKNSKIANVNFTYENKDPVWEILEYGGYKEDSKRKKGSRYAHGVTNQHSYQAPLGFLRLTEALWNELIETGNIAGNILNFIDKNQNKLDVRKINGKMVQKLTQRDKSVLENTYDISNFVKTVDHGLKK